MPRYFPGWVARFYSGADVPTEITDGLRARGAEVVTMGGHAIDGAIAGMFWRFLVADDPAVERFIVRDSDSRLNARDAYAVADWARHGSHHIHSVRDHPNHGRPLNGGLWGGARGSEVAGRMGRLIEEFSSRDAYGADLDFLQARARANFPRRLFICARAWARGREQRNAREP